jgi:hypothetical protein
VCKGKLVPIWYVLRFSMTMLKPGATNSTLGLVQHFGGFGNPGVLAIAEAMSPEPDCVMVMGDEDPSLMTEIFICQQCFLHKSLDMAVLLEEARETKAEAVPA